MTRLPLKRLLMAGALALTGWTAPVLAQEAVLVQPLANNPPHLNRLLTTDIAASVLSYPLFETLVAQDKDYLPQPRLATSWEANAESTEFRFTLREGVKFHNGETMTAEDVAFTLRSYLPLAPQSSLLKDYIEEIAAPDAKTVTVKLNKPFAPFVVTLAGIPIVPKSVYGDGQDLATHPANMEPIGTGPFKLAAFDAGERVVLERFDDYWGAKTELEVLVYPVIPDANARLLAFEGGEIGFLDSSMIDKSNYQRLKDDANISTHNVLGGISTLLLHVNSRQGPMAKPEVRRAIYQAINRDMIAERAYYGFGKAARGAIPADITWAADPAVDFRRELPFDVAAAGAALDAAGYPADAEGKRFSLKLNYISGYSVLGAASNVIRANLSEIGVDLQLLGEEFSVWSKNTYEDFGADLSIVFLTSYQDPSLGVARAYICNPDNVYFRNNSGICDPALDADFTKAGSVTDEALRREAFAAAEKRILASLHTMPLLDDPALHFGRKDLWDFGPTFATMPPNWSLITKAAN